MATIAANSPVLWFQTRFYEAADFGGFSYGAEPHEFRTKTYFVRNICEKVEHCAADCSEETLTEP